MVEQYVAELALQTGWIRSTLEEPGCQISVLRMINI